MKLSRKPKTILIAEDEEFNYMVLEGILEDTNTNLIRAHNGQEAIDICEKNKIDLILMDIRMPEVNGFEATIKIKESNPNIPIIIQTAFYNFYKNDDILKSTFQGFIAKPINPKQLLSDIKKFL